MRLRFCSLREFFFGLLDVLAHIDKWCARSVNCDTAMGNTRAHSLSGERLWEWSGHANMFDSLGSLEIDRILVNDLLPNNQQAYRAHCLASLTTVPLETPVEAQAQIV